MTDVTKQRLKEHKQREWQKKLENDKYNEMEEEKKLLRKQELDAIKDKQDKETKERIKKI